MSKDVQQNPQPAKIPGVPPDTAGRIASSAPESKMDPNSLTPEEQMERFEQDLKENDWGHQPC